VFAYRIRVGSIVQRADPTCVYNSCVHLVIPGGDLLFTCEVGGRSCNTGAHRLFAYEVGCTSCTSDIYLVFARGIRSVVTRLKHMVPDSRRSHMRLQYRTHVVHEIQNSCVLIHTL